MLPEEVGLTVIKWENCFTLKHILNLGKYMGDFLKNDDQKAFISFTVGAAFVGGH